MHRMEPPTKPRRFIPKRWQGDWGPVRLHVSDVLLVLWAATFQAWVRGLDYLTGVEVEGKTPKSLFLVERAMPLQIWGFLFLGGAMVLAAGMVLRRHFIVWCGHSILSTTYIALFVGLALQALNNWPYMDGMRSATVLLTVGTIHAVTWWRMGPRPPKPPVGMPPERPTPEQIDAYTKGADGE